jgi:hypothetical protein
MQKPRMGGLYGSAWREFLQRQAHEAAQIDEAVAMLSRNSPEAATARRETGESVPVARGALIDPSFLVDGQGPVYRSSSGVVDRTQLAADPLGLNARTPGPPSPTDFSPTFDGLHPSQLPQPALRLPNQPAFHMNPAEAERERRRRMEERFAPRPPHPPYGPYAPGYEPPPDPYTALNAPAPPPATASQRDLIDYDFLENGDGVNWWGEKRSLEAYEPPDESSGVTIATGFDLGSKSEAQLKAMGLSDALIGKLKPYFGRYGSDGAAFVRANPLVLSEDEVDAIDAAVRKEARRWAAEAYDRASPWKFDDLPANTQTVIFNLAYQYGPDWHKDVPRYFAFITSGRWAEASAELANFRDETQPRRTAERVRLEDDIKAGRLPTPAGRSSADP